MDSITDTSQTLYRKRLAPPPFDSVPQTLRDMTFSFFWELPL